MNQLETVVVPLLVFGSEDWARPKVLGAAEVSTSPARDLFCSLFSADVVLHQLLAVKRD